MTSTSIWPSFGATRGAGFQLHAIEPSLGGLLQSPLDSARRRFRPADVRRGVAQDLDSFVSDRDVGLVRLRQDDLGEPLHNLRRPPGDRDTMEAVGRHFVGDCSEEARNRSGDREIGRVDRNKNACLG